MKIKKRLPMWLVRTALIISTLTYFVGFAIGCLIGNEILSTIIVVVTGALALVSVGVLIITARW